MLKPGDQMEIDPRNPPTFVVDEGVTLEVVSLPTPLILELKFLA